MKITYWSDYACPYCYIGVTNLRNALGDLGLDTEIVMKAYELHPETPKDARGKVVKQIAEKQGISESTAMATLGRILSMASEAGVTMNYSETETANTFDAHKLTKYAQKKDPAKAEVLITRLYKAYFADGIWLGDHEALADLAAECGYDRAEALSALADDTYTETVQQEEQEARSIGVQGVPFFVFDDQYAIPGALSREQMRQALTRVLELEAEEAGIVQGAACGPDGCTPAE